MVPLKVAPVAPVLSAIATATLEVSPVTTFPKSSSTETTTPVSDAPATAVLGSVANANCDAVEGEMMKLADVAASYFVPAVFAVAAITFVVWAFLGPAPRLAHALKSHCWDRAPNATP